MKKTTIRHKKGGPADRELTASQFMALPDAEKDQILADIESKTPQQRLAESRPLNALERAQWKSFRSKALKRRAGRPKLGSGTRIISLSVERELLQRADAYAKAQGLKRSELFARSVAKEIEGAA